MTTQPPDIDQMAATAGVDPSSMRIWLEQMKLRVPKLVAEGLTVERAVLKAHHELESLIVEVMEQRTDKGKLAFRAISAATWQECRRRGYRERAAKDGERAVRSVCRPLDQI